MNVNDSNIQGGQVPQWATQADMPVRTSEAQNKEEIQQLNKDTIVQMKKESFAEAVHTVDSVPDRPGLSAPSADASTAPMSPAGGNPWTEASGFVKVLMALSEVAAHLARNAFADSKTIAAGTAAEYEMGVEAGKMARDAKYAEATADIVNGVGQLVAGSIGLATAGAMAKSAASSRNASSPYKDQVEATEVKMQNHLETKKAEREQLNDEINGLPAGDAKTDKQKELKARDDQIAKIEVDAKEYARLSKKEELTKDEANQKDKLEDKLAKEDPEFASLKQTRDHNQTQHEQYVVQEASNNRMMIQLIGEGLKTSAGALGQMAGAPFKMLEGNYQMWNQIFQTASQVFDKFIGALTSDMQSQQQMIDSLNQLEQKVSDENTRAMMHNA